MSHSPQQLWAPAVALLTAQPGGQPSAHSRHVSAMAAGVTPGLIHTLLGICFDGSHLGVLLRGHWKSWASLGTHPTPQQARVEGRRDSASGNVTSIVPRALSPNPGPQPSCLPWDLRAALSLASSPALASLSPLRWSTLSWSTSPVSQEAEVCFRRRGTKAPLPPPCKSCLQHRGSLSCLRS